MAVPKRKTTPSVRNMRRSHDAIKPANWHACRECGETVLPHHLCRKCGTYGSNTILPVDEGA